MASLATVMVSGYARSRTLRLVLPLEFTLAFGLRKARIGEQSVQESLIVVKAGPRRVRSAHHPDGAQSAPLYLGC